MIFSVYAVPAFLLFTVTLCQNVPLRGPPQFEANPQYLDSYIPASMQVMAYLTEMMKYDIKPIVTTTTTRRPTTTTSRITTRRSTTTPSRVTTKKPWYTAPPTPYHKPALYAPYIPPSFIIQRSPDSEEVSTAPVDTYKEYVQRLKNPLGDYFDRYRQVDSISSIIDQLNRQRRATPFTYTSVPTGKTTEGNNIRAKRAKPFTPKKADHQTVREVPGQSFVSQNSRSQATAGTARNNPVLGRSRSVRSVPAVDRTTNPELEMTLSTESNKSKGRALSIDGDNFNARGVDYLGFGLNELIKEIQSEREGTENQLTEDDRVKIFSTKYDDVNFGSYLLRQKKIPPTKAYVTLLSLYDLLNKESKKLMLNKYNGYATAIIEELVETSSGTSSEQLQIILQRIIDRPDTHDQTIRTKITSLVTDLSTSNSYINDALRYIPPLPFSS